MGITRKYIIRVDDITTCGIGSLGTNGVEYSLLDAFSSYDPISITGLQNLSVLAYNQRVLDFLTFLNVDNPQTKVNLINNAAYYVEDCLPASQLEPNIIIYEFLSGLRITNVGKPTGIMEYMVYPTGDNPDEYAWQTNPTFLNLNPDGVYNVAVRDNLDGQELSTVNKVVSMPHITSFEAVIPMNKTVGIYKVNEGVFGTNYYESGLIKVTPELTGKEIVDITYEANTPVVSNGSATVAIHCKANDTPEYVTKEFFSESSTISPSTRSLTMRAGDSVCYVLSSGVDSLGSESVAGLKNNIS